MRIRKTFSYEAAPNGPDLTEQVDKLRQMKNSPYYHRSFADTTGMILAEYVPKEIGKYKRSKG
jgi:hypothetical protein